MLLLLRLLLLLQKELWLVLLLPSAAAECKLWSNTEITDTTHTWHLFWPPAIRSIARSKFCYHP